MKTGRNRIPHLLLALFSLYIVLPPLWVLRTSFVPDSLAYQTSLFPDLTLANYIKLFAKDEFALAYQDSLTGRMRPRNYRSARFRKTPASSGSRPISTCGWAICRKP